MSGGDDGPYFLRGRLMVQRGCLKALSEKWMINAGRVPFGQEASEFSVLKQGI